MSGRRRGRVTRERCAAFPMVASVGGVLVISRGKESFETRRRGCDILKSFISVELHPWVLKVPFCLS